MAKVLKPDAAALREAADLLLAGEVVGMPTETVYGLAGNAYDASALARIFSVKGRPTFDPLIVHVSPTTLGERTFDELSARRVIDGGSFKGLARIRAQQLAHAFWPGPLTMVLPRGEGIPLLATSGLQSVAVRMPAHPVAQALLQVVGVPLAAPSANRFGRISPTTAQDVERELGDRIPLILDGGPCQLGLESTVVGIEPDGRLVLLRPGGVSRAALAHATGAEVEVPVSGNPVHAASPSPGMLASHYAPRTPMHLLAGPLAALDGVRGPTWPGTRPVPPRWGLLLQSGDAAVAARLGAHAPTRVEVLSPEGSLEEAARRLFGTMRALDDAALDVLFAEPCERQDGLGSAIQDRLSKACAK
jgi:L-threonylcarbamoyladenylate synthase